MNHLPRYTFFLLLLVLPIASSLDFTVKGSEQELSIFTDGDVNRDDFQFYWVIDGAYVKAPTPYGTLLQDGRRQFFFGDRPVDEERMVFYYQGDAHFVRTELHDGRCTYTDVQSPETTDCISGLLDQSGLRIGHAYFFTKSKQLLVTVYNRGERTLALSDYQIVINSGSHITSLQDEYLGPGERTYFETYSQHDYASQCDGNFRLAVIKRNSELASHYSSQPLNCDDHKPVCGDKVCTQFEDDAWEVMSCPADCEAPIHLELTATHPKIRFSATAMTDSCKYLLLDSASKVLLTSDVHETPPTRLSEQSVAWSEQELSSLSTQTYTFRFECSENGVTRYQEDEEFQFCGGCIEDEVCIERLTRTTEGYCDADGRYSALRAEGVACDSPHVCASERCSDGVCKNVTFFFRIGQWVSSLF